MNDNIAKMYAKAFVLFILVAMLFVCEFVAVVFLISIFNLTHKVPLNTSFK